MSLKEIKDKLEIGLKPDAPYRPNNLPESEGGEQQTTEESENSPSEQERRNREEQRGRPGEKKP